MLLHTIKLQKLIHPLHWTMKAALSTIACPCIPERKRGEEYLQLLIPFLVCSDDTVCGQSVQLCNTDHSTGLLLL